jgi:hypothetical protein
LVSSVPIRTTVAAIFLSQVGSHDTWASHDRQACRLSGILCLSDKFLVTLEGTALERAIQHFIEAQAVTQLEFQKLQRAIAESHEWRQQIILILARLSEVLPEAFRDKIGFATPKPNA